MLANKNYLVRKINTNKTQVLHWMRLRQITPCQLIPDIQITTREWKPDPEVIIKHDDLYARAWEWEYEKLIFESDYKKLVAPNSTEMKVRF